VTAALLVDRVSVDLAGRRVLDGASVTVHGGELVGLLGPNGAGKTTLLRSILGLQRMRTGDIHVAGHSVRSSKGRAKRRHDRSHVGYVPQRHEFAWDFPINVANTVVTGLTGALGFGHRPGVAEWKAVADALELVQMSDLADRPIGQLSGGQRQRVLVARALVLRPDLLLLDEPFTGLDMPAQEMLAELFRQLAGQGRAVLMTTHDLVSAIDGCDRLVLLNRSIVGSGTPADLAQRPELWMSTFGVGEHSALLRVLKAITHEPH